MSEFRIGGLLFTSKFDSGNLAHAEKANQQSSTTTNNNNPDVAGVGDQENGSTNRGGGANSSVSGSTSAAGASTTSSSQGFQGDQQQPNSSPIRNVAASSVPSGGSFSAAQPDLEVNLWTRKDAANTPFENGNRTWFYYAVKGAPAGKYVKMNIMNLNRQFRLFQQGMSPVFRVLPQKPQWERIREKPVYANVGEADFMISFCHRFESKNSTVEFAFCYPFSYTEYQKWLDNLDQEFHHCNKWDPIKTRQASPDEIYYCREMAIRSFDNNRVDLMTISSYGGISEEREHDLEDLFPDKKHPRPFRFRHKRVFFLSSRVHPGETPSSFVFNGFLKFILRKDDPRAIALRRVFVFKLMPLLNPDGVIRGHYRTDSRGVNLNRVYLDPDLTLHPPIYAARQILFYHHLFNAVSLTSSDSCNNAGSSTCASSAGTTTPAGTNSNFGGSDKENSNFNENHSTVIGSCENGDPKINNTARASATAYTGVGGGESGVNILNQSVAANENHHATGEEVSCPCLALNGRVGDCTKTDPDISRMGDLRFLSSIHHKDSGIAFYVDLHGHASKRGCFMYGNHVENFSDHVENLLYPKIISLNTAHFDFGGCNFTEKNMYMKDKRDGASKEGAGRVAMFKILGIIHSYTLECNYNTGRQTNCVAPACSDDGRATPPPPAGFPPRYTPTHYEDVGKAVAIAALDMLLLNPWSRISMSEFLNVQSCRSWVQKFVQGIYNGPGVPRKSQIKIPGPKPMAQTYLSNLDKDDPGGMSRNRFPLRNSRAHLMTSSTPVNETTGGSGSGGGATFSSNSGGGGGVNNGSSSNSTNNNANKTTGANNVPRSLGPIRENKAFQMRRQRLLQIHRPALAQAMNQSNASNGNVATTAAASSLAGSHNQSFSSTVNNKQHISSSVHNDNVAAPTSCLFGSMSAYQPLNSGSDALSVSSSAMGGNCYQPLKHILHQVNPSSQSPHVKRAAATGTGGGGGAVIAVTASVAHHSSSSTPSPAPAVTTGRAVYNLPVTNASFPAHAGGMSSTAAAALTYLSTNRSSAAQQNDHQGTEFKQGMNATSGGSSSNIAGLAIISPRKSNSMLQKGGAPIVLANQLALSRTKLGINRSLSLLQQTAAGGPFIYSSAGASSSTHVPNNSEGTGFYAAYERASQSSMAFKNSTRPTGSASKKNAAPRLPIDNSSTNDIWASDGNKAYSSNPKDYYTRRENSNNNKVESACYSSGDDEMYHSIATYVTSSKQQVEPSETPLVIADVTAERPRSTTNGNKRAPSAGSNLKTPEEKVACKKCKSKKHKNKKSQSQSNSSKTAHNTSSSAVGVRGETRGSSSNGGGSAMPSQTPANASVSKHNSNKNRQQSAGGDYVATGAVSGGSTMVVSGDESVVNYRKFSIKSASSSHGNASASGKKRKNAKKSTTPNANATTA